MAATAALSSLEQSAASGNNSSIISSVAAGSSSSSSSSVGLNTTSGNSTSGSGVVGTVTLSVSRARRRPARYSPEPIISSSSVNNSTVSSNNHQNNVLLHHHHHHQQQQQQQQMSDTNGAVEGLGNLRDASVHQHEQLMLHHQHQEGEQSEESNGALANREMAPAAAVAPTRRSKHRTKRKYKKRQQHSQNVDDGGKRPRVANVLLENEMLIDEIRDRKALWMRTHEQHHSSLLTAPLWEEIAKTLDTTHENIRRRWKSLKDHYRRELKKSMTDPTAPPSSWPYYKKMRFMKSQMFVSLRRKNGEDHLEILSDDEDELNNQWNGRVVTSKMENGSDTMDDYELSQNYNEMVKYEQHLQQLNQEGELEGPEEEEEDDDEQQEEQEEREEQSHISPIPSLQGQEEHQLSALQQQAELTSMTRLQQQQQQQQQPVITSDIATMTTMVNGIPATIVTTASGSLSAQQREQLTNQLSELQQQQQQQHHLNAAIQRGQSREIPQEEEEDEEEEDDNLAEMNARHSQLAQQRASINNQMNDIQRRADMSAIHQRANITAMHRNAEMMTMQHRAEMQQQRNGGLDNTSGVEISDDRGAISDDYHFFMSLMPHVRHFTSLQKLKIRNRIQQIIIEEASNGPQYDPLANC